MTEAEWLAVTDPKPMLESLFGKVGARKLQCASLAFCRPIWNLFVDPVQRNAIDLSERHIEGQATITELGQAISAVHMTRRKRNDIDWAVYETVRYPSHPESVARRVASVVAAAIAPNPSATWQSYFNGDEFVSETVLPNVDRLAYDAAYTAQMASQVQIIRCIFGNPFRTVLFDPAWGSGVPRALATGIYADRAFDRMPILADALEEAGCNEADVLLHCRSSNQHARGCWVVDAVLGKDA